MNCHQLDTILDDHAVRSLSAARRSEVDAHLASCARCPDAWAGHQALAGDSPRAPRPDLFAEVVARVVAHRPPAASRRFGSWFGIAAAALAVAALVSFALLRYGATSETAAAAKGPAGGAVDAAVPQAAEYVAGQHYRVLPAPVSTAAGANKIEVSEFFKPDCLPCFSFEPALEAWRQRQPGYVELVRVPAIFNAKAMLHAQAFYTAEALGKVDGLLLPLYEEIHVRGNPLATEDAIKAFFGRNGVDARSFDEAFNSRGVQARLQLAVELNRQYGITAAPAIAVNGRYVTNPSMAGSHAVLDVVDALVRAQVGELCPSGGVSKCALL